MEIKRCWCSRKLIKGVVNVHFCPVHKFEITKTPKNKPRREKIGKYSGYSKNKEFGLNWKKIVDIRPVE